jgi:hypothetical protein
MKRKMRKGMLAAFVAVLLLAGVTVYAIHDLGLFELDRNLNNGAAAGEDWDTLFNSNGTPKAAGAAVARSYVDDPFNSGTDNNFTTGASDDDPISGWGWTQSPVNDKGDIKNAMAAAYVYQGAPQGSCVGQPTPCKFAQPGDLILYYGLDRYANNGDANTGFWFFKNPIGLNPDGTFSGEHTVGDLLVVSDFTNGGVITDINGYIWVGSGGDTGGTLQKVFTGQDCDNTPAGGDLACGVVTQTSYPPVYFPFTPKFPDSGQPPNTYPPGTFFEGGVNLTRFGIGGCFSSFMAQTRSSQSPTSALTDLALGNFDLCRITATKVGDAKSKVGDPAHYVITITNSGGVSLSLDDVNDSVGGVFFHDGVQTSTQVLATHNITNFTTTCGATLNPGASCTIAYDYTVQAGDSDPLVNTVSITYRASPPDVTNNGDPTVQAISANAQYSTNLFQPSVAVKKCFNTLANFDSPCTTTASAVIGGSVTYNFWIKNTSSTDSPNLVKVSIQDLLPNNSAHLVLTPPAACDSLAPGATCSFQVQHTVDANDFPSVTDNFVVHYHPAGFPNDIQGSTTATLNTTGSSTVSTTLHKADHSVVAVGGHVSLGTIMHDSATVTPNPGSGPAPTGNVNFRFYNSSADCTNDTGFTGGTAMGSIALNGANPGVAHPSQSTAALGAGTYAFKAKWDGDSHYAGNTSSCETFIVDKATVSITTQVHNASHSDITNTSVALNSVVHDTAHVTGGVSGFPIPAISFTLTSNYSGTCAAGAAVTLDGTDAGNSDPRTVDSAALTAGAYAYRAVVGSDSNYDGATGACEPFSVGKANTTTATTIHNGNPATDIAAGNVSTVVAGSTVHDKATVTGQVGGIAITGNVTFTWFTTSDQCTGASTGAGTVTLDANGVAHPSTSFGPLPAGLRSFRATYNGDANYNASTGACEPLTITIAPSAIATDIHDAAHTVQPLNLPNGPDKGTAVFHDSARLTTTSGQAPTGTVTFVFFNNGTCTGNPLDNSGALGLTASNANGGSVDATSYTKSPTTAGHYAFRASYSGDPFNGPSTAACEPFTVTTIEIRKLSNGGNDSFEFTLDGTPHTVLTSGFVLGVSPGVGTTGAIVVTPGAHTAVELAKAGWSLDSTECTPRSGAATSPSATQNPTLQAADAEVCVFTNSLLNGAATRTQGFWATHTDFANDSWNNLVVGSGYDNLCGTKIITAIPLPDQNILMGGFWANIANKTTNPKGRTDLDKARMAMLQQYLAAVLNLKTFGTSDGGILATAKTNYCGDDIGAIRLSTGALGAYNEGGDSVPIDKVVAATPKVSRDQANIPYWDTTK